MKKSNSQKGQDSIFGTLYETGKVINSSLDIDVIINNILMLVTEHFKGSEFSFLSVEGNKLILKGSINHPRWGDKDYHIPVGKGITGNVAKTGEPILSNDVRKDKRYIGVRPKMLSELCVPIKVDNKVIGVLNLESKDANAFNEEHLKFISAIADQTAVAIKNANLYKSYADTVKRLSNILESSKTINSSLKLDKVLNTLIEISAKELKYDSIAILLTSEGRLYAKAGLGFSKKELLTYNADIGKGVCGKVAETGKPMIENDVSKCEFYIEQSSRTKSEMAIPIKYGDKVLGVYNVESDQLNSFDKNDLLFVSALAEQAAIAIKNAELFEEVEKFNERLRQRVEEATKELKNANEELLRLNRVKTDFVSIVSHELRTPMTSVMGYLSLVHDGEVGPVNPQQKEFLGIAHDESKRLYRLINDLLDIQKIEAKKMIYLFKEFDIVKFLNDYSREVERQCRTKGLQFKLEMPENVPKIKADEDKIRQVMTNLVSNSVKFTSAGSIKIGLTALEDCLQVSVADTGIGISKENQKLLFEKFRQVNMEASRQAGGTGLGLAIVKGLVEAHGGKIWIESEPGKGSKFTFTISRSLH